MVFGGKSLTVQYSTVQAYMPAVALLRVNTRITKSCGLNGGGGGGGAVLSTLVKNS